MICLRENVNGVLLSMRTYYRHRKNQLEFSDVEETHIIHQERDLENIQQDEIQQQDEMQQHENIYQQDEDSNNSNTDDTESFDFNEEDNEYYSDYDIEENYNNMNDDDDDEDTDDEDTDDEDIDEDENTMQIDNKFDTTSNKKIIEELKLLHLKSLYNFTESA